jgi:hypothetical protein
MQCKREKNISVCENMSTCDLPRIISFDQLALGLRISWILFVKTKTPAGCLRLFSQFPNLIFVPTRNGENHKKKRS